jgi:hypothetical protein
MAGMGAWSGPATTIYQQHRERAGIAMRRRSIVLTVGFGLVAAATAITLWAGTSARGDDTAPPDRSQPNCSQVNCGPDNGIPPDQLTQQQIDDSLQGGTVQVYTEPGPDGTGDYPVGAVSIPPLDIP